MRSGVQTRAAWGQRATGQGEGRWAQRQDCGIKALPAVASFEALTAGRGGFETSAHAMVVGGGADRKPEGNP